MRYTVRSSMNSAFLVRSIYGTHSFQADLRIGSTALPLIRSKGEALHERNAVANEPFDAAATDAVQARRQTSTVTEAHSHTLRQHLRFSGGEQKTLGCLCA